MLVELKEAKSAIGELIAGIEQHHATSNCDDSGQWSLIEAHYRKLSAIRAIIERIENGAIAECGYCGRTVKFDQIIRRAGVMGMLHDLGCVYCYDGDETEEGD